jgi:hypothetical protein
LTIAPADGTGYQQGDRSRWLNASDDSVVYVVDGDGVEAWPRIRPTARMRLSERADTTDSSTDHGCPDNTPHNAAARVRYRRDAAAAYP